MFVEGGARAGGTVAEEVLTDTPTDLLEREIGELAAHIAAATCRWLELVAEFDRRGAHEAWGFHSCGAWVAWRCAIDPRSAREHVRVPGCENGSWVDAHHIVHWAHGGETKLDNLILLCGRHHRLVHEGGFGVARKADGALVFRRPDGRVVPSVPSPARGSAAELRGRNQTAGIEVLPEALHSLGRGQRYDRGLAVEGLLARAGP